MSRRRQLHLLQTSAAIVVCLGIAATSVPAGLPSDVNLASATGVVRIDGPSDVGEFGDGGVALGDLDGDGAVDLVVCAPAASQTRGVAHVIFGLPGVGLVSKDLAVMSPDLTIVGAGPGVRLGVSAGIADMDGDGAGELLLATGGYLPALGRRSSGSVLIFRGGARLRSETRIDMSTEAADAAAFDATVAAPIGVSLVTGDFDGDGYADLAAGAPLATGLGGADKAGRVAVVFGDPFFPGGQ
ncbi:MAG: FG-GAP repeat protein, partial [Acidobacteria bacterium]|nr:FG-GAP repeat protein [Acidobacteriota bacterium]